jgi:hypothetical protein
LFLVKWQNILPEFFSIVIHNFNTLLVFLWLFWGILTSTFKISGANPLTLFTH